MANEKDAKMTNGNTEKTNDEQNKEETTKKEFFLIRGFKAVGRGCKKVGGAVNGFVKKHPYVSTTIGTAIGWGAKTAWDYFTGGSSSDDAQETEVQSLPEPEETYMLDLPDEEYAEEEKANEE